VIIRDVSGVWLLSSVCNKVGRLPPRLVEVADLTPSLIWMGQQI